MAVHHGYKALPDTARGAVAALGTFDGVHRGHAAVLAEAAALAADVGAPPAAAVFTPHPRRFFQPDAPPFRLMNDAQRARALKTAGAALVHHIPFDADLAAISPEGFIKTVLHDGLGLAGVVTGADFRFGRGRTGDAEALQTLTLRFGIETRIAKAVDDACAGGKISSSEAREALRRGEPERAAALLGRPFAVEGTVSKGDRRGRTLGFPTANIALDGYLRPAFGVYATRSRLPGGRSCAGVANLGVRPTVSGQEARLEVHLFDWSGDLYGATIETDLVAFLRPERRFDGLEALKRQIAEDEVEARRRLGA